MALKIPKLIGFIIILIALALFTVSFGTYWYKYQVTSFAEDNDSKTIVYYNYNKRREVYYNSDGEKTDDETSDYSKDGREHEYQIFQSALAFSALAWCMCVISLFTYLLSFVGIVDKVPLIGNLLALIGKYILIFGSIFGLLSVFIFVGVGNARNKDCDCENYKFLETQKSDYYEAEFYTGPTTAWFVVVIGTFFTIVGAIINIISKTFNL